MKLNLCAAAVAGAILSLSATSYAQIIEVTSNQTITPEANITDSYHVTSDATLTINVGSNNLTFADESKALYSSDKFTPSTPLYLSNGSALIKAGTLSFESLTETTNDPNRTPGNGNFSGWLTGNASLTIDVDKLLIGTAEMGGDRAFQMKNAGNTLTIYANEIISYQGDGFINAQGDTHGKANIVNIGSAERRIGRFESHTTWGDQDWGVAILQANEGAQVSLYADEVILDGSHNELGGVIGSGGYGSVLIDANTVTIDGNICGTYGGLDTEGKNLELTIKANELNMTGDLNVGSKGEGKSNFSRNTVVNLQIAQNAVIDGNINVTEGENAKTETASNDNIVNLSFNGTGKITGTVNVTQNEQGTSIVNLGGNADMSESSGKFHVAQGASVNFGGSGLWTVNEWTGTDGKLGVKENVTVEVNTVVETAETTLAGEASEVVLNQGGSLKTTNLQSNNGSVTLNSIGNTPAVTATNLTGALDVVASGKLNDSFTDTATARKAMENSVSVSSLQNGAAILLSGEEGAVSNSWTAKKNEDGTWDVSEKANQKLEAYSSVTTLAAMQWRHEMNDLTKRMGDLRDNPGAIGGWVRLYGSEMEYGSQNVTSKNASVQVGSDYQIGDWKLGAAFSYTDGNSKYDLGEADNKSYAVALYGTWMADNGIFLDLIGKYGRLSTDFELNGMDGSSDNNAYSLSAELGWRFNPCDYGFIEPQAELTYGRIEGDTFTTKNGARVAQEDFDSLIGRIGVRVGVKFPEDRGNLYLRVSGAHDFQGENEAFVRAVSGGAHQKLSEDLGGSWMETAVGGNFRLTDATNVYVDLERTMGAEVEENWRWNLGLRTEF